MNTAPNPYERIDRLESEARQRDALIAQMGMQIASLASAFGMQAAAHAALCQALGQDVLPGESPLPPESKTESRKGRH